MEDSVFKKPGSSRMNVDCAGDEMDPVTSEFDVDADEFEKEMNAEFEDRARIAEINCGLRSSASGSNLSETARRKDAEYYHKDYFDSDEDDEDPQKQSSNKRKVIDNDNLFYDPDMDEEDQKWVDERRAKHSPKKKLNKGVKAAPNSSAILNCPACFVLLCLDCQQHETYHHQFRAMFVQNCSVDASTELKFPLSKKEQKKKSWSNKKKRESETPSLVVEDPEETFHPVKCNECSTKVAVYDKDEIYHFFNVLTSPA